MANAGPGNKRPNKRPWAMRTSQPRRRKPSRMREIMSEPWVKMASGTTAKSTRSCCTLGSTEVPSAMAITPMAKAMLIASACMTLP